MIKTGALTIVAIFSVAAIDSHAQTKWYKFDKKFIENNFPTDSAIGELHAQASHAAASVHPVSCGGNDGELHVGIPGGSILRTNSNGLPVSALSNSSNGDFGVVAEPPPNATTAIRKKINEVSNQEIVFRGYYRVWNEGHDVGQVFPSNPHHVLELHPAWSFEAGTVKGGSPKDVFSMAAYQGYGASKFRPLLESLENDEWLQVAEDDDFVFVQLKKAENFYQLPVTVKEGREVTGGFQFTADVFSSGTHSHLVRSDVAVIVAKDSPIAADLDTEQDTFLLGLFSVNLRKAMSAASGHKGIDNAVFAPNALEFFAFGVPQRRAVTSCN
jgi:hypothetical protein